MLGTKRRLVLRYVAVVFLGLWLFFLGFALLIRGPHISAAQVFLVSVLLSTVTTLSYFVLRWTVMRWEQNKQK